MRRLNTKKICINPAQTAEFESYASVFLLFAFAFFFLVGGLGWFLAPRGVDRPFSVGGGGGVEANDYRQN